MINETKMTPEERRGARVISPVLRKSLDSLGDYKTEQEIIDDIVSCGWEIKPKTGRERSTEHVFYNPNNNYTYRLYSDGKVRSIMPSGWNQSLKREDYYFTPISRDDLHDPMDRLRLILRRAVKDKPGMDKLLIQKWKESGKTLHEFLKAPWIKKRESAKRFGL